MSVIKKFVGWAAAVGVVVFYTFFVPEVFLGISNVDGGKFEGKDNDWFMAQRAYPYDDIDYRQYEQARSIVRSRAEQQSAFSIPWQNVGPANIGGRITALVVPPSDPNTWYAGTAAGGVWKSTDAGQTWSNIFNESPSIGSLLLHPSNPSIIYVGTGEANPGGIAIYPGNGLWRSTDAGQNWTNIGLDNVGHIGKVGIHPDSTNKIFVAALGMYRSRTEHRGVYRSTDNGATWERVLYINDTTGACDVVVDPSNPNRVLAAVWTRYRPMTYSVIAGPASGLWLSTDAGNSWAQITEGFPFNNATLGRTSLAVAPSSPNVVYALTTNSASVRGIFKSTDGGAVWSQTATSAAFSSSEGQVWYNNVLAVHPTDPNVVYAGMTYFYRSTNGGVNWSNVTGNMHVDLHAIVIDQNNPSRLIIGNDGGVYSSTTGGTPWTKSPNLPISQFYAGTIDYSNPQRYYGGMQDNGTARTLTGSVDDWQGIYGGDGFYVLLDPTNPGRIYAESQNGGLAYSTNGGASFTSGRTGISSTDRFNWCTPFVMDLNNTLTLYVGTHRVYRTTNGMQSWTVISTDLTNGSSNLPGTITTVDVAQSNPNVVYVGSGDGRVSVTTDGGANWQNVTGTLPARWVTRVTIDPDSANVCYIVHSGYLQYDFQSHIHKTTDFGQTWTSIGGDLPDMPVNDIIIDRQVRPNLYIATDFGVMYSTNGGVNWFVLGTEFPEVPVHDLTFHAPTRTLLASTHGRSSYTIDLSGFVAVRDTEEPRVALFRLEQNYPNPFNPMTRLVFHVAQRELVRLKVFDITGREIATLVDGVKQPGRYEVQWDAAEFPSGMYISRLEAGGYSSYRRMVLLK